jgi:anti-anti-sigma factor
VQGHFWLEERGDGTERVLAVSGELDLAAAASFEAALDSALATGVARIVVDLTALEFIDSTGLSVLIKAQQRAGDTGRELGVVNPTAQVERLLTLTGLMERLSLPEADHRS